jgi:hypothetical protein
MQKVTFSADADLLDRAEQIAKAKGTTLEEESSAVVARLRAG